MSSVFALQGTMPSTLKHPSHVPMWKGVKVAYAIVALCFYPLAIGGFWAYGNQVLYLLHLYMTFLTDLESVFSG